MCEEGRHISRRGLVAWAASAALFPLLYGATFYPDAHSDFFTLWFSGHMIGRPELYDEPSLTALARQFYPAAKNINWVYPPQMLFVAGALSKLPLSIAFALWNAATALLFFFAARAYMPPGIPKIFALLTPAAVANTYFGQYGLLIGALFLWAFRCKPWAAALLTMKPHIALLAAIPILSRWRLVLRTASILAAIIAVGIAAFGLDAWRAYLGQIIFQGNRLSHGVLDSWLVYGVTPLMGYPAWAWLLFAAAAAWLVSWNFHVFTAATATFLISPYGFGYDMPVVCLGFALMLAVHWREMDWGERLFATLAFLVPVLGRFGTWPQPFILLLGLWVQVRVQRPTVGFHWGTGRTTLLAKASTPQAQQPIDA